MNRIAKTITALALLVPGAAPALAQQTETLHLVRRAGEAPDTTARRIEAAALEVCGASAYSLREVSDAVRATPCWRDAVAGARAQLGVATAADIAGRRR